MQRQMALRHRILVGKTALILATALLAPVAAARGGGSFGVGIASAPGAMGAAAGHTVALGAPFARASKARPRDHFFARQHHRFFFFGGRRHRFLPRTRRSFARAGLGFGIIEPHIITITRQGVRSRNFGFSPRSRAFFTRAPLGYGGIQPHIITVSREGVPSQSFGLSPAPRDKRLFFVERFPSAAERNHGILLVRGENVSFVTFP